MIRNETEYREASVRLEQEHARMVRFRRDLEEKGLNPGEITNVMDPLESFHLQLKEEVQHYENLKRGIFNEMENLAGFGQLLISLRIARGLSQKELATRLGVHESQVSRDERNEYVGITLERAVRVLSALEARLHTRIEIGNEGAFVTEQACELPKAL